MEITHYQKLQTCMYSLLYARLEVLFPANFDSFLTGIAIYITRAPCMGVGGGEGGGQKKFKNWADLLAFHLPRWKRPKQEECTIDRMTILPIVAMPLKKHGTLPRPRNHLPSSHSRQ